MTEKAGLVVSANQTFREYTAQASALARAVALSGVALIWLFGGGLSPNNASPDKVLDRIYEEGTLRVALVLLVAVLVLDIAQYLLASAAFGLLAWSADRVAADNAWPKGPSGADRVAWRAASALGLDRRMMLAVETSLPADADRVARRDVLRKALATPDNLAGLLGGSGTPRLLVAAVDGLFWAKLLALLVAYVAFLVYVI